MRREITGIALFAAILGQPVLAQTTAQDVSKKTGEAWDTVRSYTVEKKNDAVAYGKKLVRQTDREISALEKRAAKASDEAKAQFQSDAKELRAKRADAAKKLDQMGKSSAAAWDE